MTTRAEAIEEYKNISKLESARKGQVSEEALFIQLLNKLFDEQKEAFKKMKTKAAEYDSLSARRDELYEQGNENAYEKAFNVECEQRDVGGEIAYMVLNYGKEETT